MSEVDPVAVDHIDSHIDSQMEKLLKLVNYAM